MLNRHDEHAMYDATIHACILAVREGFPHLSARDIIDPPRQWFDAALARQIALHLMVVEFDWPKRRIVIHEERSREAINRALRTIDARLEGSRFEAHYRRMAEAARGFLAEQLEEQEDAA
ncbi:hypothetical protein [Rhizobium halophytocola]|uniref:Uncharacterized protein n=1 Tax=Rhizobium halophytocola TaxID=735519 RepID=A0ABS4E468_9HYPH|nr:hypothetical protein [Rhizobium halophytocola]MBP1852718.1 hypothetical protein [Rhizobium halophytocola]